MKDMMRFVYVPFLVASVLLCSCGFDNTPKDPNDVTDKFNSTWNINEQCKQDDDGIIHYKAQSYGGLVGSFLKKNMPVDLSAYESITFQFAKPVPKAIQVWVANRFKTVGKAGATSLTCHFDGQNVTSVDMIVLQACDTCDIAVESVRLTPGDATVWEPENVWKGTCAFGNWVNGFVVPAKAFESAYEGDKIEFVYTTDKSPGITYWLFKTIYNGTDTTLQGNSNELNEWGCASVSEKTSIYRIVLTADDVVNLKEKGLFVNGYYAIVSSVNLLHKYYKVEEDDDDVTAF